MDGNVHPTVQKFRGGQYRRQNICFWNGRKDTPNTTKDRDMTLTSAARFLILNSECHEITNGLEDDPKLSVVYLLQPIAASGKPLVW